MIRLHLTSEAFEQDIRPLYKSFFPKEELTVSFGAERNVGAAGDGRYLLAGDWREDGFTLSLYRDGDLTAEVQKESRAVSMTERKLFRDRLNRLRFRGKGITEQLLYFYDPFSQ